MARELAYHLDTTFGHFEASNPFCFLHPPSRLGGVLGSDVARLPEPSEIKLVVQGVLSRDWCSNDMEKNWKNMKWGGWCSCSCWLESEEMRRTRKKWSWQWRWLWNIGETCEHTQRPIPLGAKHSPNFSTIIAMADTASPSGYELLETIGNYRELLWTIVKCFWVAGDLTVLDWDLPAPRGFGVLRGDWRGLGVALRRWEAPRALVGVGGFEALRVLCHALVAAQMKYQSFTDALKRYESFGSINLSIYHLTSSEWGKHRECALNFIWLLCQIFHCNAWLVGVKAIPSLQLRTLQELLDMLDGLTNLQLANRPYYFQWFVLCCIQLVGSIIIRICLKVVPCSNPLFKKNMVPFIFPIKNGPWPR